MGEKWLTSEGVRLGGVKDGDFGQVARPVRLLYAARRTQPQPVPGKLHWGAVIVSMRCDGDGARADRAASQLAATCRSAEPHTAYLGIADLA